MKLVAIVMFVVYMAITTVFLWFVGSNVTSGVKAFTKSCGVTYTIERFVSGNWFCPKEHIK